MPAVIGQGGWHIGPDNTSFSGLTGGPVSPANSESLLLKTLEMAPRGTRSHS
jgi:hypothetical protein